MDPAGIVQDLRYALRQMLRAPAFAGTGRAGAGDRRRREYRHLQPARRDVIRPLDVPHAEEVVVIAADHPSDETGFRYRFSYPALLDYRAETDVFYRAETDVFADVFGFDSRLAGLTSNGTTTQFVQQSLARCDRVKPHEFVSAT